MPREHLAVNTHHERQVTLTGYKLVSYAFQKQHVNAHNPPVEERLD